MPEKRWSLSELQVDHIGQLARMGAESPRRMFQDGVLTIEEQEDGALLFRPAGDPGASQRVEPAPEEPEHRLSSLRSTAVAGWWVRGRSARRRSSVVRT